MKPVISGLHHVTAISGNLQENVDFYAGVLGLRLVKKTVNFDDPTAYHIYYGDGSGTPGSIVTFFYWPGAGGRGRPGAGQIAAIVLSVPEGAFEFWQERLTANGVPVQRQTRFGEEVLRFEDPDRIPVELVAVDGDERLGWGGAGVPREYAIRGLHSAELRLAPGALDDAFLADHLGFSLLRRAGRRTRYSIGAGLAGSYLDIVEDASGYRGSVGSGSIHHVAWSVSGDREQASILSRMRDSGLRVSDIRDRDYFKSIYFPIPGGVLFEIATETPGFAVDEPMAELGSALKLPEQFSAFREQIERSLPSLRDPVVFPESERTSTLTES